MLTSDLARKLAAEIRSLMATPVASEADSALWRDKANLIREKLDTAYKSLAPFIPEELEHYLLIPEIRSKDPGHEAKQTHIIRSLIADLESGKIDEIAARIKAISDSGSLWRSGILRAPCLVFIPFAVLLLIAFLRGYGSWAHLVIVPATIVLILVALGAACVYGNAIKYAISLKDTLIIMALCVLVGFLSYEISWYARWLERQSVLNTAGRIVVALDKYKSDHGSYPVDGGYLASLSLPENVHVYQGNYSGGQVTWSAFDLGESDITVLVEPKEYGVFVPLEKISPISFSSFAVYRYFSSEPQWTRGRVHWNFGAAYWSEK